MPLIKAGLASLEQVPIRGPGPQGGQLSPSGGSLAGGFFTVFVYKAVDDFSRSDSLPRSFCFE